jgi:hypothetical protein
MKVGRFVMLAGLALATVTAGCGRAGRPVSVSSVAADLTNLMAFCEPPVGVSDMESTYDRRGGNADWWDVPQPLPGTTNLYEALRVDGPGCIKRIWMTNILATEWLFFLDGEPDARLRISHRELFGMDDAAGRHLLQACVSGGSHSYLPIPFAKSIRVVIRMPDYKEGGRPYFHINYERYPSGWPVTSWTPAQGVSASDAMARVNAAWQSQQVAAEAAAMVRGLSWSRVTIAPGQQATVFAETRGGLVTALGVRPDFGRQNAVMRSLLLRSLVLECTWDGASQPSVQVPLGDFFCNGLHPRQFASLPMANIDGAYLCRLPMPFRRGARIVIRNDGPVEAALDTAAEFSPGDPGDRLYLHAAFHAALGTASPLHVMQTTGRGKYVGCYLTSLGMDGGWNILEGDECFYRDGGSEPVHHGTGVEDYFNGGWYYFGLCELPLHGLLEKAAMRTAQYRFHLTDPVTFRKDLRMDWEVGGGPGTPANGYLSCVAYWYQDKPGPAGSTLPAVGQRFPPLEQVGYLTIMDELFELERMGLIADAEERCAFYAGALQSLPERWMFELRRLAYREMRLGHGAVKDELSALAAQTNTPPEVAQQSRLLLWRGEKPDRAIFGAHAYADYRLLVDGKPVGQGNDPFVWQAFPVELTPGEHELQAEVTPKPQYAFFSAGFVSFFTNVISDTTWDFCRTKPAGWPATDGDQNLWRPYEGVPGIFPSMAWWRFVPNGFPCVQSGHQAGAPCGGWDTPPGQTIYLRRRIVVPETCGDRPPLPLRRTLDNSATPVRPTDDTSNEGLSH